VSAAAATRMLGASGIPAEPVDLLTVLGQ